MTKRQAIVDTARTCIGTPFRHQGRLKGVGLDCIGLVIWTMKTLGISDYDYTTYPMMPPADLMTKIMAEKLDIIPLDDARPGDLYRFQVSGEPIHVGIATDIGVLHAVQARNGIVEHRLDAAWRAKVVKTYRIPGLED